VVASSQVTRRCVFCREPRKITLEHMIPTWMASAEDSSSHLCVREPGGPTTNPDSTYARAEHVISQRSGHANGATPAR
jgi:hypothetical protein